jgi:hypothetical protein
MRFTLSRVSYSADPLTDDTLNSPEKERVRHPGRQVVRLEKAAECPALRFESDEHNFGVSALSLEAAPIRKLSSNSG